MGSLALRIYNHNHHRSWGELLSHENSCLVHLDLSYNQFTMEDTKILALKIENNHTLYGFHFRGNASQQIDHQGFLIINQDQSEEDKDKDKDKEILSKFIIRSGNE